MSRSEEFAAGHERPKYVLGEKQLMPVDEFRRLRSNDYQVPLTKARAEMRTFWDDHVQGYGGEVKEAWEKHGGPDRYIKHLTADIQQHGLQKPIEVEGDAVTDGLHRSLAMMGMGATEIPVRRWEKR